MKLKTVKQEKDYYILNFYDIDKKINYLVLCCQNTFISFIDLENKQIFVQLPPGMMSVWNKTVSKSYSQFKQAYSMCFNEEFKLKTEKFSGRFKQIIGIELI